MTKRIVVVGGGVVGLCVAYYCAREGHRVTVLERGESERDDCSFANAGMIVPSHIVPLASPGTIPRGLRWMWDSEGAFYAPPRWDFDLLRWGWIFLRSARKAHVDRAAPLLRDLHLASRSCYEELATLYKDDLDFATRGLLMLCRTERALAEEVRIAAYSRRLGIDAQVLTPDATAKLEPSIRMTIAGSIYFPIDAHLSPGRLMALLQRETQTNGVEVDHGTSLCGWRVAGQRIVAAQTTRGEFSADEFVVCAGVWSSLAVRDLGLALPLQAGKGYSLTLDNVAPQPRICAILNEARVAMTPMADGLRFGGTMELSGIDEMVNPARLRGIVKSVVQYLPEFTADRFEHAKVLSGLRPCSPDGLPYVGRFASFDNLLAATGHAMTGVSLAPITGKLIAEMISGRATSCAIEALRPDRFA